MILINIIKEKDAEVKDIMKIGILDLSLHETRLDIIMISLIVLILGGAEIFRAININHQNVMFGIRVKRPLKSKIFRE